MNIHPNTCRKEQVLIRFDRNSIAKPHHEPDMPLFDEPGIFMRLLLMVCSGCKGTRMKNKPNHRYNTCELNPKNGGPGPLVNSAQAHREATTPAVVDVVTSSSTAAMTSMEAVSVTPTSHHANDAANVKYNDAILRSVQRNCTQADTEAMRAMVTVSNMHNYEDLCAEWNSDIGYDTVFTPPLYASTA